MIRIDRDRLALSLRRDVSVMMERSKLPGRLPWAAGVEVTDLAKTGTHADRFNDGKFEVRIGGASRVFDGDVDERGFVANWTAEIEPITGSVYALPSIKSEQVSGDLFHYEALGLMPRLIGILGPLEMVLPPIKGISEEYGLPTVYAKVRDARETRVRLCLLLQA